MKASERTPVSASTTVQGLMVGIGAVNLGLHTEKTFANHGDPGNINEQAAEDPENVNEQAAGDPGNVNEQAVGDLGNVSEQVAADPGNVLLEHAATAADVLSWFLPG
ncbi:hypothetical protein FNV43_RR00035 [Rhamnella rubrinervis]|uniref:Uncharacterized protein n=1 Tax=Rhamnella rubrinervis TaxID=2594499 RepID=A0A8K0HMX6_9ROSA|nr:hypothetical protein FNV43_RR00035 [Rhamnella rubrinervis]